MASPDQDVLAPLVRTTTLAERVYEVIRAAIVDGTLPPGAPIREAALARQLGVSRTPVRDALTKLHEVGLVFFQENSRPIVVTPSRQALCEAYELREALEGMAAGLAARRIDASAASAVGCHAQVSLDAALAGDDVGFRSSDAEFHRCVASAAGNERLAGYLANARDLAGVLRQIESPAPEFSVQCGRAHVTVADAISSRNTAAAEATMRAHIKEVLAHVLLSRPRSHDD